MLNNNVGSVTCQICGSEGSSKCESCINTWLPIIPSLKKAWAATIVKDARRRAAKHGLPFSITTLDIYRLLPADMMCPILRKPFQPPQNGKAGSYSITLDKIDPARGYVKGNIRLISKLANEMKSIATPEEIIAFCEYHLRKE